MSIVIDASNFVRVIIISNLCCSKKGAKNRSPAIEQVMRFFKKPREEFWIGFHGRNFYHGKRFQ